MKMNRPRRQAPNKQFVSGGIYDGQKTYDQQKSQQAMRLPYSKPTVNYSPQVQQQQLPKVQQQQQQQQLPKVQQQQQQQQLPKVQQQQLPTVQQQQQQQQSLPSQTQPQQQQNQKQPTITPIKDKKATVASLLDESGKIQFKKIFMSRKKSSVRTKEKKIRQNRQLRKAILPKNAKMALNEVKGILISDFTINNTANGFSAIFTVNDKEYEGKGPSKTTAKNDACEKALRDYVLEKMRRKPRLPKVAANTTPATTEPMDVAQDGQSDGEKSGDEDNDDIPMINLASFAIYKLFSEWEAEGFEVPELHPCVAPEASANGSQNGDVPSGQKQPKKPSFRTELPPNWEAMHPATLLCIMRPALTYKDCGTTGDKQNTMQRSVSVIVDGEEFVGIGRSKKSARRQVAIEVCNKLFGTNFIKDEVMET